MSTRANKLKSMLIVWNLSTVLLFSLQLGRNSKYCGVHLLSWCGMGCREGGRGVGPAGRRLLPLETDQLNNHTAVPHSP